MDITVEGPCKCAWVVGLGTLLAFLVICTMPPNLSIFYFYVCVMHVRMCLPE